MNIRRHIAVAALAVAAIVGTSVQPALADHQNAFGHWGNGYAPVVWSNSAIPDAVVADAAYFWQDRYFIQGYQPPLPRHEAACQAGNGSIDMCQVSGSFVNGEGVTLAGHEGITYVVQGCDNACNHIYRSTSLVRSDLTGLRRQQVARHEFGHALGLGHQCGNQGATYCTTTDVMTWNANSLYANQHTLDAMYSMYVAHRVG